MNHKPSEKLVWVSCLVIMVCVLSGCIPRIKEEPPQLGPLAKLSPETYPVFMDNMDFKDLSASIDNSLRYFRRVPRDRKYRYGNESYTAGHMIVSLTTFQEFLLEKPSTKALNDFIRTRFLVYKAAGNEAGDVLFTGYFEPSYEGRRQKSPAYPYPVYSRPRDLVAIDLSAFSDQYKGHKPLVARLDTATGRVVPYYSRDQINSQKDFHAKSEPVVWLKSRIDRFFLEIQGSGQIDLGNGDVVKVHYAGSNGNAYRSVGRYLIEKNEIAKEDMSMQAIRAWLELNPQRMDEVLHKNKSFVFFRKEEGGPYGSLGVEVTTLRSIATDKKVFPKGALGFMQAQLPDKQHINPIKEWEEASFFVLNQDTGGAIKGTARADLFCGNGAYAKFTAGHMNKYGQLFFLVLKPGQG